MSYTGLQTDTYAGVGLTEEECDDEGTPGWEFGLLEDTPSSQAWDTKQQPPLSFDQLMVQKGSHGTTSVCVVFLQ